MMASDAKGHLVTVEQWRAINERDQSFDGLFFYGDRHAHVYCRPSCPSLVPKFNHVTVFFSSEEAEMLGYGPCRRCRPNGKEVSDLEWAGQTERFIRTHYPETLDVNRIAEACHGPSSELQQVFIRIYGVSLMDYVDRVRMDRARYLLGHTRLLLKEVADRIGFADPIAFSRFFKDKEGVDPVRYRGQLRASKRISGPTRAQPNQQSEPESE